MNKCTPPDDMAWIICPRCRKSVAEEVIHAESRTRKGWYCASCREFVQAIRRERVMEKEGEQHASTQTHQR